MASTGALSSLPSASAASIGVMSPRNDSCLIPAAASDQNSVGATSFQRPSAFQPSVTQARTPELASMTTRSVANSRQSDCPYNVGNRTTIRHSVPAPLGRHRQLLIIEHCVEIFFLDHVLCADFPGAKVTGPDPSTDRLRVLPCSSRCFRDGDHCTILLHRAGTASLSLSAGSAVGLDRFSARVLGPAGDPCGNRGPAPYGPCGELSQGRREVSVSAAPRLNCVDRPSSPSRNLGHAHEVV